ncbi:MAG: PDZ domain-containing protein [Planctomycetota bacterium]|nr:PDZ domain-containing protein [Planctomycetota bacterium]
MKKKLWFSHLAAWSLMALPSYAQEPSKQAPALDPASAPPVIVQPAEELPIPEDPGRAAPGRSKPPIVITPRKADPNSSTKSVPAPTTAPKPPAEVFGDSLLGDGEIAQRAPGGGYLGLVVEPVQGGGFGLSVVDVTNQSPAWKAGFRVGDRIVGLGGQAVTTLDQLGEQLDRYPVGTPVKFLVQRRGRSTNLTAVLQDRTLAGQLQGMQPATALPLEPPKTPYQPILPSISSSKLPSSPPPGLNPPGQSNGVSLGVSVSDLSETFRKQFGIPLYRGAAVSVVSPGTTAELAGLQPGDCISEINGKMILRAEDVVDSVQQIALGDTLTIGYYRGQQKQLVEVPLLTERMIAGEPQGPLGPALKPEQLTPQYVESLHDQIRKLQGQLDRLQARLSELDGTAR